MAEDWVHLQLGMHLQIGILRYFRLVLFPWTVGVRDLMPERRLAEIIELQWNYVLFNLFKWKSGSWTNHSVLGIGLASVSLPTLKLFNVPV